jgi:hypothetical protein
MDKGKKVWKHKVQHSRLWHMQIWSMVQAIIIIVRENKYGSQTLWQIVKKGWICKFLGFCTGVAVVSVLLRCDAMPLGSQFPTFRDNVVVPSSGVKMSKKAEFCELAPWWGHSGKINITVTVFSDEACIRLNGYMGSQNDRYWSIENPMLIHRLPLHCFTIGVWCATSASRIIFYETQNLQWYITHILIPFFEHSSDYERICTFCHWDIVAAHVVNHSLHFTQLLFQRTALVFIIKSTKYYNLYFCLCILSPYMFQPAWVIFRGRNASA